jgi:hypothetical protein
MPRKVEQPARFDILSRRGLKRKMDAASIKKYPPSRQAGMAGFSVELP